MVLFWLLAFGLAWAITVPAALGAHGVIEPLGIPMMATRLIGFAPAIAALLAGAVSGDLRELSRRVFRVRTSPLLYVVAAALPFAWHGLSVAVSPQLGFPTPKVSFSAELLPLFVAWFILGAGEEIGWRAYALPRLAAQHGFWQGATYLGLAWTVWHYPLMLASPYIDWSDLGTMAYWLGLFSLQIFLANFLICWLMARSGAVIIPTLLHTAFNAVSTVHYSAAVDLVMTVAIALTVFAITLFDAEPQFKRAET
jgi:membrane protease YdiL (CAAX protease family)